MIGLLPLLGKWRTLMLPTLKYYPATRRLYLQPKSAGGTIVGGSTTGGILPLTGWNLELELDSLSDTESNVFDEREAERASKTQISASNESESRYYESARQEEECSGDSHTAKV